MEAQTPRKTLSKQDLLYYGQTERNFPSFQVGDRVVVDMIIKEKNKERIQKFEGDVIGMKGQGVCQTFTVRKLGEENIGIEMIFPYHSPSISAISVLRRGIVRRAKLNYLRDRKTKKGLKIKSKDIFN